MYSIFYILVDCLTRTISGPYTYTMPSPASLGTQMSVSCSSGYEWDSAPYYSSQTATCNNNAGTGQWQINGGSTCVCKYLYIVFNNFNSTISSNKILEELVQGSN